MRDTSKIQNMKEVVMTAIMDLAEEHPEVLMLESDMMSCLGSKCFFDKYPDRSFNCGIAEANMIGVAAGLSSMGFVPYADSFGVFASRRDFDQFFLSVGYAKQRVHLIGTDPGITATLNGGTHMPFEDIALMRQIPDLVIIEPSDAQSCYELIRQAYDSKKSSYLRVGRNGVTHRYSTDATIELGKGIVLKEGSDITIIATGELLVNEAIKASKELIKDGVSAEIIDIHTIKPLDTDLILKSAKKTGKVLVCENGRLAGGIGEAISRYLSKEFPVVMDFLGVDEKWGEVGDLEYLKGVYGMTCSNIISKVRLLLNK